MASGALDVLVLLRAQAAGELADQRADGEPQSGRQGQADDVAPRHVLASRPREAGHLRVAPMIPTALPTTRPVMMPTARLSVSVAPSPDRPPTRPEAPAARDRAVTQAPGA